MIISAKRISKSQPRLVDKKWRMLRRMARYLKHHTSQQEADSEQRANDDHQSKQDTEVRRGALRRKFSNLGHKLLFLGTFLIHTRGTAGTMETDSTTPNTSAKSWNLLDERGRKKALHEGGIKPPEQKHEEDKEDSKQLQ